VSNQKDPEFKGQPLPSIEFGLLGNLELILVTLQQFRDLILASLNNKYAIHHLGDLTG
jgi:hypothetical protein